MQGLAALVKSLGDPGANDAGRAREVEAKIRDPGKLRPLGWVEVDGDGHAIETTDTASRGEGDEAQAYLAGSLGDVRDARGALGSQRVWRR